MPIIEVIRDTDILSEFPNKTEGDLYLWVLDHQRYLAEQGGTLQLSPKRRLAISTMLWQKKRTAMPWPRPIPKRANKKKEFQ